MNINIHLQSLALFHILISMLKKEKGKNWYFTRVRLSNIHFLCVVVVRVSSFLLLARAFKDIHILIYIYKYKYIYL